VGITEDVQPLEYVSVLLWEDDICGGPLNGGENSLNPVRVSNTHTNYQKLCLGWDPDRQEVLYSEGNFNSDLFDLYASPIDGSNSAELLLALSGASKQPHGMCVIDGVLHVVVSDAVYDYDLAARSLIGSWSLPAGPATGALTARDGIAYYAASNSKFYRYDGGGTFTEVKDHGLTANYLSSDAGWVYFRDDTNNCVSRWNPTSGAIEQTAVTFSNFAAVAVINGLVYAGQGSPNNDIYIYDIETGVLVQDNAYSGGSTGTVLAITGITQQL
jgi:hypothetical protein